MYFNRKPWFFSEKKLFVECCGLFLNYLINHFRVTLIKASHSLLEFQKTQRMSESANAAETRKRENNVMREIREDYAGKVIETARIIGEKLADLVKIDGEMRARSAKSGGSSNYHRQNQRLSFDAGYEDDSTTFDDAQTMIAGVLDSAEELLHESEKAKKIMQRAAKKARY